MGQQHLLATVAGQAELLHNLIFLCVRHAAAVKVGALAVGISLQLLETTLVVEPLVGQELAAVHTTHRDDHLATRGGGFVGRHLLAAVSVSAHHRSAYPHTPNPRLRKLHAVNVSRHALDRRYTDA